MKKSYLFLAAASAIALTACQSDDSLLAEQPKAAVEQVGVGFDVYVPNATNQTRAGRAGVMTTGTLQQTGFGIYGYQTDNNDYTAGVVPNYMWNQQVNFNKGAAGWYYAPLKYWPNETKNDSQTTPTQAAGMPDQYSKSSLDRLTFFAYAPWVSAEASTGVASVINSNLEAGASVGITRITNNEGKNSDFSTKVKDPIIKYVTATDPNNSVDLLWGVAPAGGLNYTAVNGKAVKVDEGMPLINLTKPAVNTNMKFQFQHALARLGVKVVLAADQVAAGGTFDYGNTKVTIEKIEINGPFGTLGYLNLNNSVANIANWTKKNKADGSDKNPVLTIDADHGLAAHLCYDANKNTSDAHTQQAVTGVTTTLADAIQVSSRYDADYPDEYVVKEETPSYDPTRPYFATQADVKNKNYAKFANWTRNPGAILLRKHETNQGVSYTVLNIDGDNYTTYPYAMVWDDNIYQINYAKIHQVTSDEFAASTYDSNTAYRLVGSVYTATGTIPQVGDYVFTDNLTKVEAPTCTESTTYYKAKPNYFMVIPTQTATTVGDAESRTLKVKITYYVSTKDASLADNIVYTKNVVEKDVVLPHLKNGVAYDLRLILGLTSVKVEADVADWTTTGAEVNLPQNTAE